MGSRAASRTRASRACSRGRPPAGREKLARAATIRKAPDPGPTELALKKARPWLLERDHKAKLEAKTLLEILIDEDPTRAAGHDIGRKCNSTARPEIAIKTDHLPRQVASGPLALPLSGWNGWVIRKLRGASRPSPAIDSEDQRLRGALHRFRQVRVPLESHPAGRPSSSAHPQAAHRPLPCRAAAPGPRQPTDPTRACGQRHRTCPTSAATRWRPQLLLSRRMSGALPIPESLGPPAMSYS